MITLSLQNEKRLLQGVIALACLTPIYAGLIGVLHGSAAFGGGALDLDSHVRYLSGLLLAVGLCFLCVIPRIEHNTQGMRLLTLIVAIGGLARLLGVIIHGMPGASMQYALAMELLVTPLLCLWQSHLARRFKVLHIDTHAG